jgi:hypothetical protein
MRREGEALFLFAARQRSGYTGFVIGLSDFTADRAIILFS